MLSCSILDATRGKVPRIDLLIRGCAVLDRVTHVPHCFSDAYIRGRIKTAALHDGKKPKFGAALRDPEPALSNTPRTSRHTIE